MSQCEKSGANRQGGGVRFAATSDLTWSRASNRTLTRGMTGKPASGLARCGGVNLFGFCLALILCAISFGARADVLVATNGEKFIGKVIEESTHTVVFESEFGGRLTIDRARIQELQRTVADTVTPHSALVATNIASTQVSTNLDLRPQAIGRGGIDWIQLKSGEWLRGDLKYIQNKEVEFDSDELDELSLDFGDVRSVYSGRRMFTKFDDLEAAYGMVVISNDVVTVRGAETFSLPRAQLEGITPGGKLGIRHWTGKASLSLSLQSGNNKQTTMTTTAELARRTPTTRLLIDYLGNLSKAEEIESANNARLNSNYDIRLNKDWFVRPVSLEYYHDPLANIGYRITYGLGAGYEIFDREHLSWTLAAGPSYQYTKFETVGPGEPETATTPAAFLQTKFDVDITRRLTFIQSIQSTFMKQESGAYTHHAVSTLEFEIKRHLNLDISYVWDYLQNPQVKSDGVEPEKSDYYLTVGLGVRF